MYSYKIAARYNSIFVRYDTTLVNWHPVVTFIFLYTLCISIFYCLYLYICDVFIVYQQYHINCTLIITKLLYIFAYLKVL